MWTTRGFKTFEYRQQNIMDSAINYEPWGGGGGGRTRIFTAMWMHNEVSPAQSYEWPHQSPSASGSVLKRKKKNEEWKQAELPDAFHVIHVIPATAQLHIIMTQARLHVAARSECRPHEQGSKDVPCFNTRLYSRSG